MTALVASWLLSATLKGSLLVAIAFLLAVVLRNRIPARWLCALLLLAVVRLLLPVAPAAPFSAFNLMRSAPGPAPAIRVEPAPASTRVALPRSAAPQLPQHSAWQFPIVLIWSLVVLFLSAKVIVRTIAFQRRLRTARVLTSPEVLRLVEEGRDTLRVHRSVRVLESNAVSSPSLHGWLQPALLLPEGFLESFSVEQLRYVILHELAHVRRHDVLLNWIVTAAQTLHWFNPIVAFAARRLAEERELACDALALAALRDQERVAYGGTVLELVEWLRPGVTVPAVVGMTATKRQLHRRILMIATYRKSRHSLVFGLAVAALSLVTLTDATAGEKQMVRRVYDKTAVSPATQAQVAKLEPVVSLVFESATVEDVLSALGHASGSVIQYAEGALTDEVRNTRMSIQAESVPGHVVLFETLAAVNLAARFTDTGLVIEPMPEGVHKREVRVGSPAHEDGEVEGERVIIRKMKEGEPAPEPGAGDRMMIRLDAPAGDQRTIQFHGKNGETGTFKLKIQK